MSNKKREIENWFITGRNVKEGMALYVKYGANPNILRRLKQTTDRRMRRNILDNELRLLAGISVLPGKPLPRHGQKKKKAKQKGNPSQQLKQSSRRETIPQKLPEALEPLYQDKRKKYIEVRNLHARMCGSDDVKEREQMAGQILDTWDEINAIWKQIDYFSHHGKLPTPEMTIPTPDIKADTTDPIALDRRRRTLLTYISKAKKNPERNQERLIDYQKEIDAILKILKP